MIQTPTQEDRIGQRLIFFISHEDLKDSLRQPFQRELPSRRDGRAPFDDLGIIPTEKRHRARREQCQLYNYSVLTPLLTPLRTIGCPLPIGFRLPSNSPMFSMLNAQCSMLLKKNAI